MIGKKRLIGPTMVACAIGDTGDRSALPDRSTQPQLLPRLEIGNLSNVETQARYTVRYLSSCVPYTKSIPPRLLNNLNLLHVK